MKIKVFRGTNTNQQAVGDWVKTWDGSNVDLKHAWDILIGVSWAASWYAVYKRGPGVFLLSRVNRDHRGGTMAMAVETLDEIDTALAKRLMHLHLRSVLAMRPGMGDFFPKTCAVILGWELER